MSTVAEHLAMMELYKANDSELFRDEAFLLTQTHWKELIAQQPATEMQRAREEAEKLIRELPPERAEEVIGKWRAAIPVRASSSRAEVEIPKGYALVPVKPTIAMCIRGAAGADNAINGHAVAQVYEFMLAAAEAPNAESQP